MNLSRFLYLTAPEGSMVVLNIEDDRGATWRYVSIRPRIICADGFSLSVQASEGHYCSPRTTYGNLDFVNGWVPYNAVEIGFPSAHEDTLQPYIDGDTDPDGNPVLQTNTVFAYVPYVIVSDIVDAHGGIDYVATVRLLSMSKEETA